jgi:hypothetical protein
MPVTEVEQASATCAQRVQRRQRGAIVYPRMDVSKHGGRVLAWVTQFFEGARMAATLWDHVVNMAVAEKLMEQPAKEVAERTATAVLNQFSAIHKGRYYFWDGARDGQLRKRLVAYESTLDAESRYSDTNKEVYAKYDWAKIAGVKCATKQQVGAPLPRPRACRPLHPLTPRPSAPTRISAHPCTCGAARTPAPALPAESRAGQLRAAGEDEGGAILRPGQDRPARALH